MDFFAAQDNARRRSLLLALGVGGVICLVATAFYALSVFFLIQGGVLQGAWHPRFFAWSVGGVLAIVLIASLYKAAILAGGGRAVAESLGARPVVRHMATDLEERLLNIVEEMSIASGMPIPDVYVMEREMGINAFAAGRTVHDAVVCVTQGCLELLDRAELQGVVAHEFSHIFNGDMRLNLRMIALLHGLLVIGLAGIEIIQGSGSGRRVNWKMAALGVIVAGLGYVGFVAGRLLKAAFMRQREFLADANAVEFTRDPVALARALRKVADGEIGSRVRHPGAESVSHLFFAEGIPNWMSRLTATHPPIRERIRRLDASTIPASGGMDNPISPIEWTKESLASGLVSQVGAPTAQHLARAREIVESIPPALATAFDDPAGAEALVLALLASTHSEEVNFDFFFRFGATPWVCHKAAEFTPVIRALGPHAWLPLLDRATAALRDYGSEARRTVGARVQVMIEADGKITMREYVLYTLLEARLRVFRTRKSDVVLSHKQLAPDFATVLSRLAWVGHDSPDSARRAFMAAGAHLPLEPHLHIFREREECAAKDIDHALSRIDMASGDLKRHFLLACAECVAMDVRATASEVELLRAVAERIGCPVPPVPAHLS